ncbi:MAG: VIT and VWA domain-containing protein [Acidobacteria bacterium]|nr:VIT and VWA domain-containing protein [Acidobacteriota bacterium]
MRFSIFLLAAAGLYGDAGSLIPANKQAPDPAVLSMEEMAIDVQIDGASVKVLTRQIFANKTAGVLEGNYVFALPGSAILSDFAVWDGATRIPGVILERRRAEELYNDIRLQAIDPGLLQLGERDVDEAKRTSVFSARVVPIPGYGTKRMEMEYHSRLDMGSILALPLKPDAYKQQRVGRLWITVTVNSAHAMKDFQLLSKGYPLQILEKKPNLVRASLDVRNFELTEDFVVKVDREALLVAPQVAAESAPKTVVALFDASLSMQWEKLERSMRAVTELLMGLGPQDKFHLLVFNSQVAVFAPGATAGGKATAEQALAWLKTQPLRGATDLGGALAKGLALAEKDSVLVLFSDGGATSGQVRTGKLLEDYARAWAAKKPRTFVYAVGDDANGMLMKALARQNGVFEWVRSTEPEEFKLRGFLEKLGKSAVEGVSLDVQPRTAVSLVYSLHEAVYPGSEAVWVGQYGQPGSATFKVRGASATVNLPASETAHPQLPRTWAKARVDALLEKIDREGEDKASIDEIIRLSKKYKFVTPYTSFLAAPRALLRPRLIRPGDPVIRVRTDAAIASVVAVFPFGLTKALKFLPEEDIWQTRFLAPADMVDGTHAVKLVMRDKNGRTYREAKTFLIVSKPPLVSAKLSASSARRGERVMVTADAGATTRTITAKMYGAETAWLKWDPNRNVSVGYLTVPAGMPAGKYAIKVTAEDIAHNISTKEVFLAVLP